jgi:hypothetical protein
MIYSLGVILLCPHFRGPDLAAASVLFTGRWGAGMDLFGDASMAWIIAGFYLCYLPVFWLARRTKPATV